MVLKSVGRPWWLRCLVALQRLRITSYLPKHYSASAFGWWKWLTCFPQTVKKYRSNGFRRGPADLDRVDGFISVERFQSLSDSTKLLSLSFWRDEEAVKNWRNHFRHRAGQTKERSGIFADYRLRVATVMRDYGLTERAEAPSDLRGIYDVQHPRYMRS